MTFQLKAALILILALVTPLPSGAEPPAKLARIGWLGGSNPAEAGEFFRVFVQH